MQILTLHAIIGLQTKFEANWTKNGIFSLPARLGPLDGRVDIQNWEILMQILTLHAMIGLQTKFEAK